MAVLLTRPVADSQRIADELQKDAIEALIWPLTRIDLLSVPIDVPDDTDALVFSSAHAIRAFCAMNASRDLTAFCVGARTASLAQAEGFGDVRAAGGNFDALVDLIRQDAPRSVLYLRGREVTGDMAQALGPHGISLNSQIVYAARPAGPPDARVDATLAAGQMAAVTIWSRRNADLLCESIQAHQSWKIAQTSLIAISESAAAPLGKIGFRRIIVASRPNATHMIAEIRAAVR